MPLTLDGIARLRRAGTIILKPGNETNVTRAEWNELLDAAEAWALLRHACKACGPQEKTKYGWRLNGNGDLLAHIQGSEAYPTPQAAVLAELKEKL